MEVFEFKIGNSNGKVFILKIHAYNFEDARQQAYEYCYKAGYCFLGRI